MKRSFPFSGAAFSGHKNLDIFNFQGALTLDIFIFRALTLDIFIFRALLLIYLFFQALFLIYLFFQALFLNFAFQDF